MMRMVSMKKSFVDQIKVITNEVDSVAKNKEEDKKTKK